MSVVIGIQPKAETTKSSFLVYAEGVTEEAGRPTVNFTAAHSERLKRKITSISICSL
jgi:ABC-type histidine transport system ATPase subunit